MFRLLSFLAIAGLLLSDVAPLSASVSRSSTTTVTPSNPTQKENNPVSPDSAAPLDYLVYVEASNAQPLLDVGDDDAPLYDIEETLQLPKGPYRTTLLIRGQADLARLKQFKIKVLAVTKSTATVIVKRGKLAKLAKLGFFPRDTVLVTNLKNPAGQVLSAKANTAEIVAAAALDTDSDGLNDTEESYWCTNPSNADSDNDKVSDGKEVNDLRSWILHDTATRPASGKPFAGWPPGQSNCFDSDYDSVPDAVEVYVFGLNPNRESTARDKFDDGQKLFGLTNCPGSGGGCGYGALPRLVDWGVIFAEMPSWVKPPYDSPFVAAFPEPEIDVVPSSFVITLKNTIQGTVTKEEGTAITEGTSKTEGSSRSDAETRTWNDWEESSETHPISSNSSKVLDGHRFERGTELQSSSVAGGGGAGYDVQFTMAPDSCDELGLSADKCGRGLSLDTLEAGSSAQLKPSARGQDSITQITKIVGNKVTDIKDKIDKNVYVDSCDVGFSVDGSVEGTVSLPPALSISKGGSVSASCTLKFDKQDRNKEALLRDLQIAELREQAGGTNSNRMETSGSNILAVLKSIKASYPLAQLPTRTTTKGKSWGGATTTTHTVLEEHTISHAEQIMNSTAWATAWATDTVHAADLTFTYQVSNKGSDYAREITNIAFNIYIGNDSNPIYTYFPASDIGGEGKFTNFMPGEVHTYSSRPIPLTLNQVKSIDLGESIFIVVEDFSYGVDELFYQDAITSGSKFVVDSGDGILRNYVLPTWGNETIQDVAQRFFPSVVDAADNLLSLTVPEYATATPNWKAHALAANSWWSVYLRGLGDGSTTFNQTIAKQNSSVLIRINLDSDRDAYTDRTEIELGTNPSDPSSHPTPQMLAATHSVRVGDLVTTTLAIQNNGNFDAFGIEAVMYSPDWTTTIFNNVIGGSGRADAASRIVLGSRVLPATLANWRGSAQPYSTGSYTGDTDKIYTLTANENGGIGKNSVQFTWTDGAGNSGTVNFGATYQPPLPITLAEGVQISFDTGTVHSGDVFTVAVHTPHDTFSYKVNTGNSQFTTPVVVVSYNDPQGNHRFLTPVDLPNLNTDLVPYASQMRDGVGVDIGSDGVFNSSTNNSLYIVANSPDDKPIINGHILAEFMNDGGDIVARYVYTDTFQPGPTIKPLTFNVSLFNPPYNPNDKYTILASFTDPEGNVIDKHARLFSTFAADPAPILNVSPPNWNISPNGPITQGDTPQQTISLVNTGIMPLNVVVTANSTSISLANASGIISIPPAGTHDVIASLDTSSLVAGPVSLSITVRSNDPAHQTTNIAVTGTVSANTAQANAFDVKNQPWTKRVRVYGNVSQFATADFTHNILPDATSIEPCKVYDPNTALKGVGKYCADFNAGTVSAQVFGDGTEGDLNGGNSDSIRTALSANAAAGQPLVAIVDPNGFTIGQEVLVIQMQGVGAGSYEFGVIASKGVSTITLQKNLTNNYTQDGSSRAQVLRIPHYRNVSGNISAASWDGSTGGIVAFRATGTVSASVDVTAEGFRGGQGTCCNGTPQQGESYTGIGSFHVQGANGGGGGNGNPGAGGGGGYGSSGVNAQSQDGDWDGRNPGAGGSTYGDPALSALYLGSGGGGGDHGGAPYGQWGGNGGGIIFIAARVLTLGGTLVANGQSLGGWNTGNGTLNGAAAGGGSGGSVRVICQSCILGTGNITATGGSGGTNIMTRNGGAGGVGRISFDYQDLVAGWSTNPPASNQQRTFYIAEKPNDTTVRFTVPDSFTNGKNYIMQFGRRLVFAASGNQVTTTRLVPQNYSAMSLNALITNLGAGGATTLNIDVGNDGTNDATYNATITQPTTISPTLVITPLNNYVQTHPPVNGSVDVPIKVTINRQADVILTNLVVTPGLGIDLAFQPGDLQILCKSGISCLPTANRPVEGDVISPTVTVRNLGNEAAASAVVGYYLGDPNNGGRLLGNSYVATIAAGGTAIASLSWKTTGYTGNQTIFAVVDPPNAIGEGNENNNVVSLPFYIKTKPDLRIQNIAVDKTDTLVGEAIRVTTTISNISDTDSGTHVTRLDSRGERGDTIGQNLSTPNISAGGALNLTSSIVPTIFGLHVISMTADSTSLVNEAIESNNVLTRTIFVGLKPPTIDAGGTDATKPDNAYTASAGYGFLNGTAHSFANSINRTVRLDGSGEVRYQFDGLQPTRFYHLDATFYQEGDNLSQKILFDNVDSGQTFALFPNVENNASVLVPPSAYADGSMVVSFKRASGLGAAYVSELSLVPVEYTYVDAGGADDLQYSTTRGYGYQTGYAVTGASAEVSYRTAVSGPVNYRFDKLTASKAYNVNLSLDNGGSGSRTERVLADGAVICGQFTVTTLVKKQCLIPPAAYSDGSVVIGVERTDAAGPVVNEIAIEQKTRDVLNVGATPTPTSTATRTFTPTRTGTPTSTATATATPTPLTQVQISNFSAQWSGSNLQLSWTTTLENKVQQFELWRAVGAGAFAVYKTFNAASNCGNSTQPSVYTFTDANLTLGTTYGYQLKWIGVPCGGSNAMYANTIRVAPPTPAPTATATPTVAPACTGKPTKPELAGPKNDGLVRKLQTTLRWKTSNCADTYVVVIKDTKTNKRVEKKAGLSAPSYDTRKLVAGQRYRWKVFAVNTHGRIGSKPWEFSTK